MMNLHFDPTAFEFIINEINQNTGVRRDVLEKDYYVTLLLQELSQKPHQLYAYFKGGTALYKALKSIRRFSEDIDLTVNIDDCPNPSQAKKRLENAAIKYCCLSKGETIENNKGSIVCKYLYKSLFDYDVDDALQRFGCVKVEATSFTVSEPITKIKIAPHLYELSNDDRKQILRDTYNVVPFEIETISLERIFVDKVFATQFYFERKDYAEMAKHIYDLTVLLGNKNIKSFISDAKDIERIIAYKRREELNRKGGVSGTLQIKDFNYFDGLAGDNNFFDAFAKMQKIYVLNANDVLSENDILCALAQLRDVFANIRYTFKSDKY